MFNIAYGEQAQIRDSSIQESFSQRMMAVGTLYRSCYQHISRRVPMIQLLPETNERWELYFITVLTQMERQRQNMNDYRTEYRQAREYVHTQRIVLGTLAPLI